MSSIIIREVPHNAQNQALILNCRANRPLIKEWDYNKALSELTSIYKTYKTWPDHCSQELAKWTVTALFSRSPNKQNETWLSIIADKIDTLKNKILRCDLSGDPLSDPLHFSYFVWERATYVHFCETWQEVYGGNPVAKLPVDHLYAKAMIEWESRLPLFTQEPPKQIIPSSPPPGAHFECSLLQAVPKQQNRLHTSYDSMEDYQAIMKDLLAAWNADSKFFDVMAQFISVEIPQIYHELVQSLNAAMIKTADECRQGNALVQQRIEAIQNINEATHQILAARINAATQEISVLNKGLKAAEEKNAEMLNTIIQQGREIANLRAEVANMDTGGGCIIQ